VIQEQNLQEQSRQDQSAGGQFRLVALSADVGRALTTRDIQADMLRGCVEAMVTHLDAAFARIWVLDEAENVLVLCASAGQYTHLDGPHGRVPVGQFKIGLIAQERQPHLTNAVVGDPRVSDQEWARREGMVAFAGYPLVVDGRLVGVVALFARQPLAAATLLALGSVADQIGVGVERLRADGERRASQEALAESQERLRDAQARLESALAAGGVGTWTYDLSADRVVADANLARLFSVTSEDAAGGSLDVYLQAIHPDDRPQVARAIADAVASGEVYEAQYRVVLPDGSHRWLATRGRVERDAEGEAIALPGVVLDVTEQVERERRERFLADLAERARTLTDPETVIADAVRSLGGFLGVSRCLFADIDIEADTCAVRPDYHAGDGVATIEGVFPISAFGPYVVAEYAAGRVAVVDDVRLDPIKVPPDTVAAYDAIGVRAYVAAPVMHSSRLVSAVAVHSAAPRRWESEEVQLIRAVVERTWLTVEVLRQQRALAHEAETTARVLASITDAFFTLDTDWRYTSVNDQADRLMSRGRDEVMGKIFWEVFPHLIGTVFDEQYHRAVEEQVRVSFETHYPTLNAWLEVRAFPSRDGLSVFFRDISERKGQEAERERLAERERNIASQLQAALQPEMPALVPGLSVGRFTRAALDEAQIGGDFYDLFPLDKELYAVVIGDVSGKALAAAQQIALIRNSLRTTLYLYRAPAQAATALNKIVTAHDLLVGFVTVWVGVYDAATGQITYCSCGHEPGLVRRAGGAVEALETTGPPLGVAENAEYGQSSLVLSSDDCLLLYTDGISEAGPSRRELLGTEGLIRLIRALYVGKDAQAEAEALVAEVSAYTNGVFRDDVAVLLARRL